MSQLNFAINLARRGGKLIMGTRKKVAINFKNRNEKDWVSDIDIKVERFFINQIRKQYPNHNILSEESGDVIANKAKYTWVIDPIDGTANFVKGWPYFGVSVALLKGDDPFVGVVYNPNNQEMFSAQKGKGAYLNNRKLTISKQSQTKGALGVMEFSSKTLFEHHHGLRVFDLLRGNLFKIRLPGSASLDACYSAAGRADFCVLMNMKAWDVAAANLIYKEAGGRIFNLVDKSAALKYLGNGQNIDVLFASGTLGRKIIRIIDK